jgi:pimeloyl-ACP methyl ester carboxylesterase
VNGVLYYVRGGHEPTVILIHGFPQDWYEFHAIMPALAKQFTVVGIDLPGISRSTGMPNGYDAADMAKDLRGLARRLGLTSPDVVGHDNWRHGHLRLRASLPARGARVMILDVPLPGIQRWDQIQGALVSGISGSCRFLGSLKSWSRAGLPISWTIFSSPRNAALLLRPLIRRAASCSVRNASRLSRQRPV